MNSWFAKFISLDEMKSSSLVISFLVFSGIGVYLLVTKGDLPPNLTTFLLALAGIIGGVNAFNFVSSNLAMSKNNQQMPMQNNMNGYNNNSGNSMGMMNQPIGVNQPTISTNGTPNNTVNQTHNLNDPPVQQMPIVQNSGVKSPV